MAITLATQESKTQSFGTTITLPITVPAGNDRFLVVGVGLRNLSSITVTGVEYAGTALSNNDQDGTPNAMNVANGTDVHVYLWRLIAPVVGTNNIVVTLSGSGRASVIASSWTGVHQTTALGVVATNTGSSTGTSVTPTVDVSSAASEVVVDMFIDKSTFAVEPSATVGAGQTAVDQEFSATTHVAGHSYEAGAATVTMSWTVATASVDHDWATVGVPLKPSSTTSPTISANTSFAEIAPVPWRKAPALGFQSSAVPLAKENMMLNFEAAAMFPRVIIGQTFGETVIYDDGWVVPSVAKAGRISITGHPTPMTPDGGSLFVSTQDTLMQYPFPHSFEPHLIGRPMLAHSYADNANLTPVYYPSAILFAVPTEVRYLHIVAQNMTSADGLKVALSWDGTGEWHVGRLVPDNSAWWTFLNNFGRILRLAVALNDASSDDPTAPIILEIEGFKADRLDMELAHPPDTQSPEVG